MNTPTRLGRGLSSLLTSVPTRATPEAAPNSLPLAVIRPGHWQPRGAIDEAELADLASSIRATGVLQPILVRPLAAVEEGISHEIIAGERRWRASRQAGLREIPVIIRSLSEREALAAALIENIQREDLNALEEARALERLIAEHSLTHEDVAKAVGRSRVAVSNLLRLLELSDEVAELVEKKLLTMGHARALLGVADRAQQAKLGRRAAEQGLSVRQIEEAVRQGTPGKPTIRPTAPSPARIIRMVSGNLKIQERGQQSTLTVEIEDPRLRDRLVDAIRQVLDGE